MSECTVSESNYPVPAPLSYKLVLPLALLSFVLWVLEFQFNSMFRFQRGLCALCFMVRGTKVETDSSHTAPRQDAD